VPWASLVTPSFPQIAVPESPRAARLTILAIEGGLVLGMIAPIVAAKSNVVLRKRLIAQFATIGFFLPASRVERRWFVAVFLSAGICEEIIYRGFLIAYLSRGPLA